MENMVWAFELDGRNHTLDLDPGSGGAPSLRHNGNFVQLESRKQSSFLVRKTEYAFQIHGQPFSILEQGLGKAPVYSLLRNGEHFKGVDQAPEIATVPAWGWAFVGGCLAIPVLTLGGVIPAVLGFGGASACWSMARGSAKQPRKSILTCVAITLLCYFLLFGLVGLIAVVRKH
jgi:hypothetical protein